MLPKNRLLRFCLIIILGQVIIPGISQEERVSISGFGEFTYTSTFGDPVDEDAAEVYEDFGLLKEYSEARNDLVFPGFGLVIASNLANDKLTLLTEINFKSLHNDIDVGIERCFLNYSINNLFNIRAGIYSTPFGSLNRVQRVHGFLSNSVKPRDMVNLELGLIPARIFGIELHGSTDFNAANIGYAVSLGSGRGLTPEQSPFEVDVFEEQESSLSISGALEFIVPFGDNELMIGLSGFSVPKMESIYIDSLGKEIEQADIDEIMEEGEEDGGAAAEPDEEFDAESMELAERGFAPYLKLSFGKIDIIAELHITQMEGEDDPVDGYEFDYTGFSGEISYKTSLLEKQFVPYARFDMIELSDNENPYLGLHLRNSELKRYYTSNNSVIMIGASWSVFSFNKIKLEYNYVMEGAQPQHAILFQSAFMF